MSGFKKSFKWSGLPKAHDEDRVSTAFEHWESALSRIDDTETIKAGEKLVKEKDVRTLMDALFGNSPYLAQCIQKDPAFFLRLAAQGPDALWDDELQALNEAVLRPSDESDLSRILRRAKRRAALLIASADIAGLWELEKVTSELSRFAEICVSAAARFALKAAHEKGRIELADEEDPEKDSGLVILGMGKLAGKELNYSSDIDLIVLFDEERARVKDEDEMQQNFVRITQTIVRLLDERTAEGYVFRTDLRLRPDPASTPIALSTLAAETYYEGIGQNWERAVMIKARPIAGDTKAGDAFLKALIPFVWRKSLDFAAIQDIHAIKDQINTHKGSKKVVVKGHNIKLGRGGIREVELFVQIHQLLFGGRNTHLRVIDTCSVLKALSEEGLVPGDVSEDLIESYRFLRRVEHRLQMVNDKQTHTLPDDDDGIRHMATFLGYDDTETFTEDVLKHLKQVETHYGELFAETTPGKTGDLPEGNLVFTGSEDDPDTLETLENLGFKDSSKIAGIIRGWHHSRIPATRSTRSRELLTQLVPGLLAAFGDTSDPDAAFIRFHEFLSGLPAGVQLFSLFSTHPKYLALIAQIMGTAPRLAAFLSRQPTVLDAVLDPDFFEPPPDKEELASELDDLLSYAPDFQDFLDDVRRWAHWRRFQVGVQMLRQIIERDEAQRALSDIADLSVTATLENVQKEFARRHGKIPGPETAILALGKLGSREMSPSSDVDLVVIYDVPEDAEESDGGKPITPGQYYARLTQRFINAITALTGHGRLYEVDLRLRPSGNAGPLATRYEAFVKYQEAGAWTWEHMALTRGRVIAGDDALCAKVDETIRKILTKERDGEELREQVAKMRAKMAEAHGTDLIWQTKHHRGGLVDIEFIAQYLQLRHGHENADILHPNTDAALAALGEAGYLDDDDARALRAALSLWQRIQALLRLCIEGDLKKAMGEGVPKGLIQVLCEECGEKDFEALREDMEATYDDIHKRFQRLVEKRPDGLKTLTNHLPDSGAGN